MKSPRRRFRLFTDWNIQGKILIRIGIAWVACQCTMVATILGFLALEGTEPLAAAEPSSPWRYLVPALIASSVVFPVVLLDMVIFTNKFTGPLRRFRQHLQNMAEGQPTPTLHFRPGDLLTDLSVHVNEIRAVLIQSRYDDELDRHYFTEQLPQTIGADH